MNATHSAPASSCAELLLLLESVEGVEDIDDGPRGDDAQSRLHIAEDHRIIGDETVGARGQCEVDQVAVGFIGWRWGTRIDVG